MALCVATYVAGTLLGVLGAVQTVAGQVDPSTASTPVLDLFVHNVGVLVALGTGLATMGLLTAVLLFYNGIVLGWVVGKALTGGFGHLLLTGILPHAIPEIAAYVVSGAATSVLGVEVAKRALGRQAGAADWRTWWRWQAAAVGLLAVAAVLERTLSHV